MPSCFLVWVFSVETQAEVYASVEAWAVDVPSSPLLFGFSDNTFEGWWDEPFFFFGFCKSVSEDAEDIACDQDA